MKKVWENTKGYFIAFVILIFLGLLFSSAVHRAEKEDLAEQAYEYENLIEGVAEEQYGEGYDDGYADGYTAGYEAGLAAATSN